jgi:hypothetical protein
MSNRAKFSRLSKPEQRFLIQAFVLLPVLALALRSMGLRRTQVVLARLAPRPSGLESHDGDQLARRISRLVAAAAVNGPYRANCLKRSLALWWLLRRQGLASDLRIGVRKGLRGIEAHAWVERGGRPLNDDVDVVRQYSPFPRPIVPGGAGTP